MNVIHSLRYSVSTAVSTAFLVFHVGVAKGQPCSASFNIQDEMGTPLNGTEILVCAGATLNFFNVSEASSGSTLSFGEWNFDGNIVTDLIDQEYQFSSEGVYSVSLEISDLLGCSDSYEVTVKVLGEPNFTYQLGTPSCHGECNGSLFGFYVTPNQDLYLHTWFLDGNEVGVGDVVLNACAGDYTVLVTDAQGCTDFTDGFNLSEPNAIDLSILPNGPIQICPGDDALEFTLNVDDDAVEPYVVSWSNPSGLSAPDQEVVTFTPTSDNINQFLEVTLTDALDCQATVGIQVSPRRSDLTGQILIDGAPCEGCELQCFKLAAPGVWTPWVGASTSGGDYAMTNIGGLVDCIMRLVPPSATYPDLPTLYYVNGGVTHRWSDATVLTTGCGIENSLTKNISTSTLAPLNGQANIEGAVFYQYTGKVQETDPIPGVDVVVEKVPPGNSLTVVTTDGQGRFNFDFMPQTLGDTVYNFYVDIPGVPMQDNYFLTVGANDLLIQNVNFCLIEDSTAIQTCSVLSVTESLPESAPVLSVHPNPSDDVVVFNVTGSRLKVAEASLMDLTGRTVKNIVPNASHFELSVRELPAGLYTCILRLEDGFVLSKRLMVGR
jgi:hypothetical protein